MILVRLKFVCGNEVWGSRGNVSERSGKGVGRSGNVWKKWERCGEKWECLGRSGKVMGIISEDGESFGDHVGRYGEKWECVGSCVKV